jgi:hypothetical protein
MRVLNYYKTMNNKGMAVVPTNLIYESFHLPIDTYRGVEVHNMHSGQALVLDGIIISERVKQSRAQIDMLWDNVGDYHSNLRPMDALHKGKSLIAMSKLDT